MHWYTHLSVLNAAARLIYHMRSADHITDALVSFHWLPIPERIEYKIAVLTYKVLQGSVPGIPCAIASRISPVDENCALPALVACWYHPSGSQQSAEESSQLLVPVAGTPCRKRRHQHHLWQFSVNDWNHFQTILSWSHHVIWHRSNYILTV